MVNVDFDKFKVDRPSVIGIDGSTTNTGIALVDASTNSIMGSLSLARDAADNGSPVRYKVAFKKALVELFRKANVTHVFYEEPFVGFIESAKVLFMLRTSVEEVIIENEPEFDHIKYSEVSNTKWKQAFLGKNINDTALVKQAIRDKVVELLPFMKDVTQDEMDATGLAFVGTSSIREGIEDTLKSKKKAKPFKFEQTFFAADDDSEFFEVFSDYADKIKIPNALKYRPLKLVEIPTRGIFENHVYNAMGEEDVLLIVKFKSTSHANIIMENRLSNLASNSDYLYDVIWRKSRKKA